MSSARAPIAPSGTLNRAYQRFRQLIHEGAKFGIVGLIGVGVTNLIFDPLHNHLHVGVLTSVTIATAAATAVTFVGNRYWSFRHREGAGARRESVMFVILNVLGLLIQYAVLGFSNYGLDQTGRLANVIALNVGLGLGTLFRFWSYRKWVWVPPEVRLARLRQGRHRKGRAVAIPVPVAEPLLAGTVAGQTYAAEARQPQDIAR